MGTYWPLGSHWLVGGLASFGQAHTLARYKEDGETLLFFTPRIQHQFNATYRKYAAEAYLTWQPSPLVSTGLAYRLVQLRLTDVTDLGQSVPATSILRYEPMLFFRLRPSELLQFQVAFGVSPKLNAVLRNGWTNRCHPASNTRKYYTKRDSLDTWTLSKPAVPLLFSG